jgi:hypothetical protein
LLALLGPARLSSSGGRLLGPLFGGCLRGVARGAAFPFGGLYTREDRSWHVSQNAKLPELRFSALLTEDGAERLEAARA